jgi:hypothetical protein
MGVVLLTFCLGLVLVTVVTVLTLRYGVFLPHHRRFVRYPAFYSAGFWDEYCRTNRESGFVTKTSPAVLTDSVFSFSLYGDNTRRYFEPLERSLKSAKVPGWHFRVYVHDRCRDWIEKLRRVPDTVVVEVVDDHVAPGNSSGAFWRFLPLCEPLNVVVLDTDDVNDFGSILKTWETLGSDVQGQVSMVPPWPRSHIQGGCIYKKKSLTLPFDQSFIQNYPHRSTFGSDEVFTTLEIAPHWAGKVRWVRPWYAFLNPATNKQHKKKRRGGQ